MLSYYKSQEDVLLGCKGSVNIAAAVVTAHKTDPYRLDVVVPGEQHFYLKAGSPHERQNWLVALGSVKSSINSEKAYKALDEIGRLTQKQCEVRLYCDSLMQQIHSVRCLVSEATIPDVQKLDECSSLLSETCDAFIRALEDCVQLSAPSSPLNITGLATNNALVPFAPSALAANSEIDCDKKIYRKISTDVSQRFALSDSGFKSADENGYKNSVFIEDEIPTFFSQLIISILGMKIDHDSLDVRDFLTLCDDVITIFDLIHPTAFIPIKLEFRSRISTILRNLEAYKEGNAALPRLFVCDQLDFLLDEDNKNKNNADCSNSVLMAIMWLKWGLEFLVEFFRLLTDPVSMYESYYAQHNVDLSDILNTAYGKTLKLHHQWICRGVFALAAKEAVVFSEFYESCFLNKPRSISEDIARKKLSSDLSAVISILHRVLSVLSNKLTRFNLLERKD